MCVRALRPNRKLRYWNGSIPAPGSSGNRHYAYPPRKRAGGRDGYGHLHSRDRGSIVLHTQCPEGICIKRPVASILRHLFSDAVPPVRPPLLRGPAALRRYRMLRYVTPNDRHRAERGIQQHNSGRTHAFITCTRAVFDRLQGS